MKKWRVLAVLAAAQFVMVIDTSVMNVSISQLVHDFETDVSTIQSIIALFSLVMATCMIVGGKIGDIVGRKKAFAIGLVTFGIGSLMTALSPSITVLTIGWSVLEGVGAALVMPALVALIAINYTKKDRALAYGVIGGVSGAAVAVGPIVGGWVTTNLTWRVVFAAETVIVAGILAVMGWVATHLAVEPRPRLDWTGAFLSATGLGLIVIGALMGGSWGFIQPRTPVAIFGFAPTLFVMAGGVSTLGLFGGWLKRRKAAGKDPLIDPDLMANRPLRSGLSILLLQQTVLMGIFFVIPLYLQVVLGMNAFDTGLKLLPVSIALVIASVGGSRIGGLLSPRAIVRSGLAILLLGSIALLGTIKPELNGAPFAAALALVGIGIGLLSSQIGNILQSSVQENERSEAGGLQYTAQNLGSSLGSALIGAIVIGALATGFLNQLQGNPALSKSTKDRAGIQLESGISFVSVDEVRQGVSEANLPAEEQDAIVSQYSTSQLAALKLGLLFASLLTFMALFFTTSLPSEKIASEAKGSNGG